MLYYTYTDRLGAEMRLMFDATELFNSLSTPLVILGSLILIWAVGCVAAMLLIRGAK
jgi:hypothetical protein